MDNTLIHQFIKFQQFTRSPGLSLGNHNSRMIWLNQIQIGLPSLRLSAQSPRRVSTSIGRARLRLRPRENQEQPRSSMLRNFSDKKRKIPKQRQNNSEGLRFS